VTLMIFNTIKRLTACSFALCAAIVSSSHAQWQTFPAPWTNSAIFLGRDIHAFVVLDAPGGGRILYASGTSAGVTGLFRSDNNGQTWKLHELRLFDGSLAPQTGLQILWAGSVPQASGYPSHAGVLYATAGHPPENFFSKNFRCDLLRSDDLGSTWTIVAQDVDACIVTIDPSNPQFMYALGVGYPASSEPRLFRSKDGGVSWQEAPNAGAVPSAIRVAANGRVYLIAANLYVSEDHGDSWQRAGNFVLPPLSAEPGFRQPFINDIAPWRHPQFGDDFAVATTTDGLYTTADGGKTWQAAGLQGFEFGSLDLADTPQSTELELQIGYRRSGASPMTSGMALMNGSSIVPFALSLPAIADVYVPKGGSYAISSAGLSFCANVQSCIGGLLPALATLIEFHNSILNHYFMTPDSAEAAGIDQGAAGPGWARTGQSFKVYANVADTPHLTNPVCRFYGTPGIGPNSHFFTSDPAECAQVSADRGWMLETVAAFGATQPQRQCNVIDGLQVCGPQCEKGRLVYRLYNNRFSENDSNHRYVVDPALYQSMQAQGWVGEDPRMCTAQ
jgi:hypothetical protein